MNLTAVDITTSSVLLNWTEPNGQSSRYRVEYDDKNVIAENTSIMLKDLIPGAQYTFRVFAVAADHVTEGRANQISLYTSKSSDWMINLNDIYSIIFILKKKNIYFNSQNVCYFSLAEPDIIMNLTAVDITTSSVLLNWTEPNGQSSRYRVEYDDKNVIAENTSIMLNDLIPGAQYTFRVFAVAADHVTEGRANQISLNTSKSSDWMINLNDIYSIIFI